jgi:uncharacterized RDD family membrane protein YckC
MTEPISIVKKRVYALTFDFLVITVCNYFLMTAATNFIKTVFFHFPTNFQIMIINKISIMTSISMAIFTFAYFSLFCFLTNGHTLGKSIFNLRVKSNNGSEITLNQSILRTLGYFTCILTGDFLLALSFIRKDEKSLADVFSNTSVVSEDALKDVGTEFHLTLVKEIDLNNSVQEEISEEKKAA